MPAQRVRLNSLKLEHSHSPCPTRTGHPGHGTGPPCATVACGARLRREAFDSAGKELRGVVAGDMVQMRAGQHLMGDRTMQGRGGAQPD